MREKLFQYWHNMQPREQKIIGAGGGFLILFLIYLLLESGTTRNQDIIQKIEQEQQLLTWMQPVVQQLLLTRGQRTGEPITPQNILAQVEYSLSEAGLSAQIVGLNLVAENQVQIEFESVAYETLVGWLYAFSKQGVIVRELMAAKTKEEGMVKASVSLSAAS